MNDEYLTYRYKQLERSYHDNYFDLRPRLCWCLQHIASNKFIEITDHIDFFFLRRYVRGNDLSLILNCPK